MINLYRGPREAICNWLRANGINPDDVPIDTDPVYTGGTLTVEIMTRNAQGRHFIDPHAPNRAARTVQTYTVTEPPADVYEHWLRPPCPTCGR